MISLAMVLCVCVLRYSCGVSFNGGYTSLKANAGRTPETEADRSLEIINEINLDKRTGSLGRAITGVPNRITVQARDFVLTKIDKCGGNFSSLGDRHHKSRILGIIDETLPDFDCLNVLRRKSYFGKLKEKVEERAKNVRMKVDKYTIRPPVLGVALLDNAKEAIAKMNVALVSSIVHGAGVGLQQGWKSVETFKLPGWQYIMVFPNAVVSVVDKTANTAWFLKSVTGKTIAAAEAFTIYAALKVVSAAIGPAIRTLHFDCVKMHRRTHVIDTLLVDTMEVSDCKLCGISRLEPVNNVTLTDEGDSTRVVVVPHVIRNINVKISAVNVTGYTGILLDDVPMHVHIEKTNVNATVNFKRGIILKFVTIRLRIENFEGFNIKFDVKDNERSTLMDIVEGISDNLSAEVERTINNKFEKFEEQISKLITGRVEYKLD